jgi:hypothetical protein
VADEIFFHPLNQMDVSILQSQMHNEPPITHRDFDCGACGQPTNGRIIASMKRKFDGATLWFCVCSCPRREGALMVSKGGVTISQFPEAREFHVGANWPPDLSQLFEEGARAYAAGAYTATAMVARKLLMVCACHEGDTDGKRFVEYVNYITGSVIAFPKAKDSIDKIRGIGNEANHNLTFVSRDDARRAMSIVTYMLNTIYSLPSA